ncbi:MAG: ubiquinone anaerobic biosynthesis protein UbiV [Pseudomonadota bacterium]
MTRPEIALGPLLFNWTPEQVRDYYRAAAACGSIDRVYLGEVVCAKRRPLMAEALEAAAGDLAAAGKTVVWSSLALPASPPERRTLREQVTAAPGPVEINDLAAAALLAPGARFVAGPLLNVYNEDAAAELQRLGCERLVGNVELALPALAAIGAACPGLELEMFAYGRLPLAISGRCHHAHLHGRRKDSCQFVCDRDPDGAATATLEGEAFLAINGVQVLSRAIHLAAPPPAALEAAGITALRLSPHTGDPAATADAFAAFYEGRLDAGGLAAALRAAGAPEGGFVDGFLHGRAGREAAAALAG